MNNGSIGIIGGADGPTAIMVSYPDSAFLYIALGVAVISLVTITVILIRKNKK